MGTGTLIPSNSWRTKILTKLINKNVQKCFKSFKPGIKILLSLCPKPVSGSQGIVVKCTVFKKLNSEKKTVQLGWTVIIFPVTFFSYGGQRRVSTWQLAVFYRSIDSMIFETLFYMRREKSQDYKLHFQVGELWSSWCGYGTWINSWIWRSR